MDEVEDAIEEIMSEIAAHELASAGTESALTRAFYLGIVKQCQQVLRELDEEDGAGADE